MCIRDSPDIDRQVRDIDTVGKPQHQRGHREADHDRGEGHRLHQGIGGVFLQRIDGRLPRGEPRRHDEEVRRIADQRHPDDQPDQVTLEHQVGASAKQHSDTQRKNQGHVGVPASSLPVRTREPRASRSSACIMRDSPRAMAPSTPTPNPNTTRKTPISKTTAVMSSSMPKCGAASPAGGQWVNRFSPRMEGTKAVSSAMNSPANTPYGANRINGSRSISPWPKMISCMPMPSDAMTPAENPSPVSAYPFTMSPMAIIRTGSSRIRAEILESSVVIANVPPGSG